MTTVPHTDRASTTTELVPRVKNLQYRAFHRRYQMPLHPVIAVDAVEDWPARSRWTLEYFRSQHGDLEVDVDVPDHHATPTAATGPRRHQPPPKQRLRMRDFIDRLESAAKAGTPAPYLRNVDVNQLSSALAADLQPRLRYTRRNWLLSPLLPRNWICPDGLVELFIGGWGSSFPFLHYDQNYTHAFITQLYGEKEFILYPPEDSGYLYPDATYLNASTIPDIEHVDLAEFPLFAEAHQSRVTLGPGETLFVPSGWWHTTKMAGPSISVSTNTVNRANWWAFQRDITRERAKGAVGKAAILNTYLAGVGLLQSLGDLVGLL